jgi:hypothetical protein
VSALPVDAARWRTRLGAERVLGAVAIVAALALAGSTFLYWYVAPYSSLSRTGGGFELLFGVRDADAWTTVPETAAVLLACAVVVAGAIGWWWRAAGPHALVRIAIAAAVAAVVVAGLRLADPPARRVAAERGIEGTYFTRANRVPGGREAVVSQALSARGGVDAALGAAVVALVATAGIVLLPSRPAAPRRSAPIDASRSSRSSS